MNRIEIDASAMDTICEAWTNGQFEVPIAWSEVANNAIIWIGIVCIFAVSMWAITKFLITIKKKGVKK